MLLEMVDVLHETEGLAAAGSLRAPYPCPVPPDHDIPGSVLSALLCDQSFVVITGAEGVPVEQLFNVLDRLQQAGLGTATMTAPVARLSLLDDVIRKAMTAGRNAGRPLAVIIQHAEMLSVRTLLKLVTLSMLRADGRPVLRFLLAGTPALWPALREAGLGALEHDPAVHVELAPGHDGIRPAALPPWRDAAREPPAPVFTAAGTGGVSWEDPPRLGPIHLSRSARLPERRPAVTRAGLTLAVLLSAACGVAWIVVAPPGHHLTRPAATGLPPAGRLVLLPDPEPPHAPYRTNADREPAVPAVRADAAPLPRSGRPASGSPETPRSVDPAAPEGTSALLVAPRSAVATAPDEDGLRVTVRYGRGDGAAQAQAMRVLARLREAGVPADGPVALGEVGERSTLSYYFAQDEQAARTMAQRLLPRSTQIRRLALSDGASLPRPGGISICIGSHDDRSDPSTRTGRQS